MSLMEEEMGDKPFLTLEMDEHGGDAGYLTRIEAYMDVLKSWESRDVPHSPHLRRSTASWEDRKLWIPPMHVVGSRLMAGVFRGAGREYCEGFVDGLVEKLNDTIYEKSTKLVTSKGRELALRRSEIVSRKLAVARGWTEQNGWTFRQASTGGGEAHGNARSDGRTDGRKHDPKAIKPKRITG